MAIKQHKPLLVLGLLTTVYLGYIIHTWTLKNHLLKRLEHTTSCSVPEPLLNKSELSPKSVTSAHANTKARTMIDIQIQGLTPRQMVLADIIWACEDKAEVDRFINALPTQTFRNEAKSIVDLMKMAAVEQLYDGISDNPDAKVVIDKIAKR